MKLTVDHVWLRDDGSLVEGRQHATYDEGVRATFGNSTAAGQCWKFLWCGTGTAPTESFELYYLRQPFNLRTLSQRPQRRTILLLARHVNTPWAGRLWGTIPTHQLSQRKLLNYRIHPPNANTAHHCVRRAIGLLRGSTVLALALFISERPFTSF